MPHLEVDGGSSVEDNIDFISQPRLVLVTDAQTLHGDVPAYCKHLLHHLGLCLLDVVEELQGGKEKERGYLESFCYALLTQI